MFICVRFSRICSAALGLWLLAGISLLVPWNGSAVRPAFSSRDGVPVTVIVDAGHGGEDGGALSPSGVKESDINLAIAEKTESLLRFCGVCTEMTRREDVSIHDPEAATIRQKKTSALYSNVIKMSCHPEHSEANSNLYDCRWQSYIKIAERTKQKNPFSNGNYGFLDSLRSLGMTRFLTE